MDKYSSKENTPTKRNLEDETDESDCEYVTPKKTRKKLIQ